MYNGTMGGRNMETCKKKLVLSFIFIFLIVTIFNLRVANAQEKQEITVLLDGYPVTFDVPPVLKDGTTLVPFRAIAEALNISVNWEVSTQTVTATDNKTKVKLQIGNKTAIKDNMPLTLRVSPQMINQRTLIPLRFFSEAFDCDVDWDKNTYTVKITSPPKEMFVTGFYALGDSQTSSWTNLFGKSYPEYTSGNTGYFSSIAFGWYSLDNNGNLLTKSRTGWQRPDGWEKVLEVISQYKLKSEMVIHVTDGDKTISNLLSSPEAIEKAISSIVEEAKIYDSVNLDFEGLGLNEDKEQLLQTQQKFTEFVKLLKNRLDVSKSITLTLHAPNSVYKGYDYKTLGEIADKIIIMAYDYGTKPEPEELVIQAIEQATEKVPKEKLLLGISIPNETLESFAVKIGLAKRFGLGGIAIWRLGLVQDEMWDVLKNSITPRR